MDAFHTNAYDLFILFFSFSYLASASQNNVQWVKDLGLLCTVVWSGGCSSDWTPSLGTSICCESGPRKGKKTENK